MNKQILWPLTIGPFLLAIGWACSRDPTSPKIDPFCNSQPPSAIVAFEDANLEAAIRDELLLGSRGKLTCGLLEKLTTLTAAHAGIASLAGIENLTRLTVLRIRGNSITDVSALSGLRGLTFLAINENGNITDISALSGLTSLTGTLWMGSNSIADLSALSELTSLTALNAWDNSITDLSGLSGLTGLTALRLHINSITDLSVLRGLTNLAVLTLHTTPALSDIQPLLDNLGLGAGDDVLLRSTNVSCTDLDALRAKGVGVVSDCP